jgi:hypothetical protein
MASDSFSPLGWPSEGEAVDEQHHSRRIWEDFSRGPSAWATGALSLQEQSLGGGLFQAHPVGAVVAERSDR